MVLCNCALVCTPLRAYIQPPIVHNPCKRGLQSLVLSLRAFQTGAVHLDPSILLCPFPFGACTWIL